MDPVATQKRSTIGKRMQKFEYEERDAEEILRRAITIDAKAGNRTDLMQAAAELGISEDAVLQAEKEYRVVKVEQEDLRAFTRQHRQGYWEHMTSYVVVNVFLLAINLLRWEGHLWAIYPILGWGIGVAMHSFGVFNQNSEDFQKEFRKWREKKYRTTQAALGAVNDEK